MLAIILRVFSFTRMSADLNAVSLEIRERFFDAPDWLMNPEEGKMILCLQIERGWSAWGADL